MLNKFHQVQCALNYIGIQYNVHCNALEYIGGRVVKSISRLTGVACRHVSSHPRAKLIIVIIIIL